MDTMSYVSDLMNYDQTWPTEDPNDLLMFATTQPYNNTIGPAAMAPTFAPSIQLESEPFPVSQFDKNQTLSTAQPSCWDMQSSFDAGNSLWPAASTYLPASIPSSACNSPLPGPFDPGLANSLLVSSPPSNFGDLYSNDFSLGSSLSFDAYSDYSMSQAPTPNPQSQSQSPADTTSSGSGGFQCPLCGDTFVNQKNLDRHFLSERHNEHAPKYTCACGYVQARKDNYRRHLQSCSFHIDYVYVCNCGDRTLDKAYHEAHIDKCGRKRRGKQSSK
ncbi:hypothetical protein QBC38DRAFT_482443 [Podospora fimiseda]|uniref:C2H2-type domain-containing protein n=1 Tax=Podospora fimiseda TaxID=252190 RepID=A0AAN7BME8_9PEZI|nr:hypothetical protein QBC38DRAFT_482443 [Podospora fimiseda]